MTVAALTVITPAGRAAPAAPAAPVAPVSWPTAVEANALLGHGVNVVVDWQYYHRGFEAIDPAVAAPVVKAGGFDSVRIFVDFIDAAGPAPDFTLDPAFVTELRAAIAAFTDQGLAVMINYDGTIGTVDRFVAVWGRIATQLADLPPTVFFELANEPLWTHTPGDPNPDFGPGNVIMEGDWNAIVAGAVPAIRATNPERTIVVTGPRVSFPQYVPTLTLPPGDGHLIVTFHQYQPLDVTSERFGPLRPWAGTADELAALQMTMRDAVCWARTQGVPLSMSEFGTTTAVDPATRIAWTTAVARLAEAEGISWHYFEFSSDGFGVWDRHLQQWRQPLYQALFPSPGTPALGAWAACPPAPTSTTATTVAPVVVVPTFTG